MNVRAAVVAFLVLLPGPTYAGDLENGVRFYKRNSYEKALSAFKKAAAKGNIEAQRYLGLMYYRGEGVTQDNLQAVRFLAQAATAGDVESASDPGMMYEFGMGVATDIRVALDWYLKAAELGDAISQWKASVIYYRGQGVKQDRIEAAKWWTIAMMQGGRFAEQNRNSVESAERNLQPEELAEGRRRADEWVSARAARTK